MSKRDDWPPPGHLRDLESGREWKANKTELREANRLLAKHRDIASGDPAWAAAREARSTANERHDPDDKAEQAELAPVIELRARAATIDVDLNTVSRQVHWIVEHLGEDAADCANYAWYASEDRVETKVYGHGVLVTIVDGPHSWFPFPRSPTPTPRLRPVEVETEVGGDREA
jgi:hypothetical protein